MNEQPSYYNDLITRYFSGEASPEDIKELSAWVQSDPENRKLFEEFRKAWELTIQSSINRNTDPDAELLNLRYRLETEPATGARVIPMQPGKQPGTLWRSRWLKVAAALLILVTTAAAGYFLLSGPRMVRIAANGGIKEIVLPDGSHITLKSGAELEYPSGFKGKTRPVKLSGEAYFEVAHDEAKPFIVTGNHVNIEVLGTKFNVNTLNPEGKLSVVLDEGSVALTFTGGNSGKLILSPGERAEADFQNLKAIKLQNTDPNYLAWKTGHLQFDNTALSDIVRTLNSVYGTSISLSDPSIGNCRVTATFDHQPVASVLKVLQNTLDLKISKQGDVILIAGSPCNNQ